jgi:hypothetical protein
LGSQAEQLLRSALEKIVFFECRVQALEGELDVARGAARRAQEEASRARAERVELERSLAEARGALADALSKNGELLERARLLEEERQRFMATLIEQARVGAAPSGAHHSSSSDHEAERGIDLGEFIAELRGEVERLQKWKEAALAGGIMLEDAGAPKTLGELRAEPASVPEVAARFEANGRIGVTPTDVARLEARLSTRAERVLYETSMADLSASDPRARKRAADALRALGSGAAAPLVAAALGREEDADVKAALCAALGALSPDTGAEELLAREMRDDRPRVRVAAVQALADTRRETAVPRLCAALGDRSAFVRRRAAMCLGYFGGATAETSLIAALEDADAGVVRMAALALSGRPTREAQRALLSALHHEDASVRRVAAATVRRWAGDVAVDDSSVLLARRSSHRLAERLALLGDASLREAVLAAPAETNARAKIATSDDALTPQFGDAVLQEVRVALRGRTTHELAESLVVSEGAVERALAGLVSQGAVVARGSRFFAG